MFFFIINTIMKGISQKQQQKSKRVQLEKSKNILPEGTSDLQTCKRLELIKTALNYPLAQYIVFSQNLIKFSWIIVKQQPQSNEPIFHLYCETLKRRFLSSQKQSNNIGCNYIISKNERPQKDQQFIGKLRGNFRNNELIVYDGGENPKKKLGRKRKQFAFIKFNEQSIFGQNQQQKMEIVVPQVRQVTQQFQICPKYLPKQFIPNEEKQNLLQEEAKTNSSSVVRIVENLIKKQNSSVCLENLYSSSFLQKQPNKIDIRLQLKEFQNDKDIFAFNSRGKNTYSMRFGYPLNMVQSFGIALTFIERSLK